MMGNTLGAFAQSTVNLLNSTGNVGIGTSSPNAYPGFSVLSIDNATSGGVVNFRKSGTVLGQLWSDVNGTYLLANTGIGLHFSTDGNEKMTILPSGSVGIGYTTPIARLEVTRPAAAGISTAVFHSSGGQAYGHVLTLATDGDAGADEPKLLFSYQNKAFTWALGGNNNSNRFSVWEGGGDGTFGTGFGTERLTVLPGGNIGIGLSTPTNKLDVNGTIHSKAVKVDMIGWSDYVFDKTYKLRSLNEVRSYITVNHHLPDVPSEKDVVDNGLNVGEMNKVLTRKIEELTLYLIQKEQELKRQQNEIESLKKRFDAFVNAGNKKVVVK
jgi:hypothetical protein